MSKDIHKGKADEFLKVGEKYFYLYIPGLKITPSIDFWKKNKITVTKKQRIDKVRGFVEFLVSFQEHKWVNYNCTVYDERVRGNYAFLEGDYNAAIVKYDKANIKKALMNMVHIKLNATPKPTKKRTETLLHNVKCILKEISETEL